MDRQGIRLPLEKRHEIHGAASNLEVCPTVDFGGYVVLISPDLER